MQATDDSSPKKILALDLGTSSIGWSLFESDDDQVPTALLDLGIRHFQEVIIGEKSKRKLKNEKRREARGARRNLARRRQRRNNVLVVLQEMGLIASGQDPFASSPKGTGDAFGPYRLRAEALDRQLEAFDLARAFYHLGQRRGFRSNRGAKLISFLEDPVTAGFVQEFESVRAIKEAELSNSRRKKRRDREKELEGMLVEVESLEQKLKGKTLGQYFYSELQSGRRVRGRHTLRKMYVEEFHAIWDAQHQYYPDVLTDRYKTTLFEAIFFQRPLKVQTVLRGNCSLEPTKKKALRATLVSQEHRYWSDIVHLATEAPSVNRRNSRSTTLSHDWEYGPLTPEQRQTLADALDRTEILSWTAIRKLLKMPPNMGFNLMRTKENGLVGNRTAVTLRSIVPEFWSRADEKTRDNLIETLLTQRDKATLYRTMKSKYGFEPRTAFDLATLELEPGMASLSARAMTRILPYLRNGMRRTEAIRAAGYQLPDNHTGSESKLPQVAQSTDLTSPRVKKALGQLRRVVNELIRTNGKISTARIELSREMTLNEIELKNLLTSQAQLKKECEVARTVLRQIGIQQPTDEDIKWYRLAKQTGFQCPYTGESIGISIDSMSRFEIEHIIPNSYSYDDSYNNLTLCRRDYNARKGDMTPFEAFGHTTEWLAMVDRINKITGMGAKRKIALFKCKERPDQDRMIARQLTESSWISRAAMEYLKRAIPNVEVTKGKATQLFRDHWSLFSVLNQVIDEERAERGWPRVERKHANQKSRDDLRHHAVDAVAIAFTTRSVFQRISRHRKLHADGVSAKIRPLSNDVVPPCPDWLHAEMRTKLSTMVVSHEPTRGLSGALHEESLYGRRNCPKRHRIRVPIAELKKEDVERIIDDGLKGYIQNLTKKRNFYQVLSQGIEYKGSRLSHVLLLDNRFVIRKELKKVKPPEIDAVIENIIDPNLKAAFHAAFREITSNRIQLERLLIQVEPNSLRQVLIEASAAHDKGSKALKQNDDEDSENEPAEVTQDEGEKKTKRQKPALLFADRVTLVADPALRAELIATFALPRTKEAVLAAGIDYCGTRVRHVRIEAHTKNPNCLGKSPDKYVVHGNNHHVAIFENLQTGKREGRFVDMMEAARRVRQEGRPAVDTSPPPGWRFVNALYINDTVRIVDEGASNSNLYRIQKLAPNTSQITLRIATAGSVLHDEERLIKNVNVLRCVKLEVSPAGRIREIREPEP